MKFFLMKEMLLYIVLGSRFMEGHFVIDHSSFDKISKRFFIIGRRILVPVILFHFLQTTF
jgi:hypothetical protein